MDVSKAPLDVARRPRDDCWHVSHAAPGMAMLVERVQAIQPALLVWEATGGLAGPGAGALAAAARPVVVVTPATRVVSPKRRAGWPRRIPLRHGAWRPSRRPGGRRPGRCQRLRHQP
jgi:hypothetical protein